MSLTRARADNYFRKNTPASLRQAISLAPDNAAYHALLAEHLEGEGGDPDPEFIQATTLSPLDAQYLIRLGTRAEIGGDLQAAERYLTRAAEVNHRFLPLWSLLNFYFRRSNAPQFWHWFTPTLEIASDGYAGVFRLAWEQTDNADLILSHIPSRPQVLLHYMEFLIGSQRIEAAAPVAVQLAESGGQVPVGFLLHYCELTAASDMEAAVRIWNTLSGRKLIPLGPLNPSGGAILGNPFFFEGVSQRGFDWHYPSVDGIFLGQTEDRRGIQIHFSGTEPEKCTIYYSLLAARPGVRYRLAWESGSPAGDTVAGLTWNVRSNNRILAVSPAIATGRQWTPQTFDFTAEQGPMRLALEYNRGLGDLRPDGEIVIRNLSTEVVR